MNSFEIDYHLVKNIHLQPSEIEMLPYYRFEMYIELLKQDLEEMANRRKEPDAQFSFKNERFIVGEED